MLAGHAGAPYWVEWNGSGAGETYARFVAKEMASSGWTHSTGRG